MNSLVGNVSSVENCELQMKIMRFNTILLIGPLVVGCASLAKVDRSYTLLFVATAAGVRIMDFVLICAVFAGFQGHPAAVPMTRFR